MSRDGHRYRDQFSYDAVPHRACNACLRGRRASRQSPGYRADQSLLIYLRASGHSSSLSNRVATVVSLPVPEAQEILLLIHSSSAQVAKATPFSRLIGLIEHHPSKPGLALPLAGKSFPLSFGLYSCPCGFDELVECHYR